MIFSLFLMRALSLNSVSHLCFHLIVQKILREQRNLQSCLWWNYINFPRSIPQLLRANSSRYFSLCVTKTQPTYINRKLITA